MSKGPAIERVKHSKRAMRLAAIHSGSDWADGSSKYLAIPEGMDLKWDKTVYNDWYYRVYVPNEGKGEAFRTFPEWVKGRGARAATMEEIEVFEDT